MTDFSLYIKTCHSLQSLFLKWKKR